MEYRQLLSNLPPEFCRKKSQGQMTVIGLQYLAVAEADVVLLEAGPCLKEYRLSPTRGLT